METAAFNLPNNTEAPTGTMVEVDAAKPVSELSEKEQLEIFQIYTR